MKTPICLVLLIICLASPAAAAGMDQVMEAQYEALDTTALDQYMEGLDAEIRPFMPDYHPGESPSEPKGLAQKLLLRLGRELAMNIRLLGQLVLLAVLCALLTHLGASFAAKNLSQLAFFVCFLALMGLAVNGLWATIDLTRRAVMDMVGLMYALVPAICTLLTTVGAVTTSALFNPLVLAAVEIVAHLAQVVLLPMAVLTTGVTLVGHLSEGFSLSKLATLLRDMTVGMTGVILAGFVGLISIRGVAAAAADGIGLRTAKYLSGTFVPVVGKGMSDAMDTVAGCSLVLKNSLGGFGAWSLVMLTALPLLKIFVLAAVYRLAAALIQPLGDSRIIEALNSIGNCFTLLFAVVALIGLAFFLGLTILVALGNLTFALR